MEIAGSHTATLGGFGSSRSHTDAQSRPLRVTSRNDVASKARSGRLQLLTAQSTSSSLGFSCSRPRLAVTKYGVCTAAKADGAVEAGFEDVGFEDAAGQREGSASQGPDQATEEEGELVTQEDLKCMDEILQSQSQEALLEKVDQIVQEGRLTKGVLEAFFAAIKRSEEQGSPKEMIEFLTGITQFLVQMFQHSNRSPAMDLLQAVMQVMEQAKSDEEAIQNALDLIHLGTTTPHPQTQKVMSVAEFVADLDEVLSKNDAQDHKLEADFQARSETMGEAEVKQYEKLKNDRQLARDQLETVKGLAGAISDGSIKQEEKKVKLWTPGGDF